jgi:hypothetical protein
VRGRRLLLKDLTPVRRALDVELERAYRALHFAQILSLDVGPGPNTPRSGPEAARALLCSALQEKVAQVERRIFLLLAVLYPDAGMEQIAAGIYDGSATDAARRRGNAVELLENLLDRHLKERFLPLLEDLPRAGRLAQVAAYYPPPTLSPSQALEQLAKDEAAWVRACALWCISESDWEKSARDSALEKALSDPSPIVRELGLVALDLKAPDRAGPLAEQKLRDEAPLVRRQAALITSRHAALASGTG